MTHRLTGFTQAGYLIAGCLQLEGTLAAASQIKCHYSRHVHNQEHLLEVPIKNPSMYQRGSAAGGNARLIPQRVSARLLEQKTVWRRFYTLFSEIKCSFFFMTTAQSKGEALNVKG